MVWKAGDICTSHEVEQFVRQNGFTGPLAYHDARWRRDKAPLLDHLGAVIDHVEPHTRGGVAEETNLVTACNKCNMRKNAASAEDFSLKSPLHRVRGKYGEPKEWDGLSTLFVLLVKQTPGAASQSEREWLRALKSPTNGPVSMAGSLSGSGEVAAPQSWSVEAR